MNWKFKTLNFEDPIQHLTNPVQSSPIQSNPVQSNSRRFKVERDELEIQNNQLSRSNATQLKLWLDEAQWRRPKREPTNIRFKPNYFRIGIRLEQLPFHWLGWATGISTIFFYLFILFLFIYFFFFWIHLLLVVRLTRATKVSPHFQHSKPSSRNNRQKYQLDID